MVEGYIFAAFVTNPVAAGKAMRRLFESDRFILEQLTSPDVF